MATIPASVLHWASAAAAGGAPVESVSGLRSGGSPWMLRFAGGRGGPVSAAVLRFAPVDDDEARAAFDVEACSLEIAAAHGIPAPRVIALDLDGAEADALALLLTVVEGTSRIAMTPIPGRLRAFGAACAAINRIPAPAAEPRLPYRTRPIAGVDFAAVRRARGTKGLVADAEQAVADLPVPDAERVFVHGDLWQGNTMWAGGRLSAVLDWDCSGVGSYGVDLGSARCDAAVMYGPEFAADVLAGWQEASGRPAEHVAYWDVVAALSTPPQMAEFVEPIQGQGRTDLDQPVLAERRDAFLRAALDQLI